MAGPSGQIALPLDWSADGANPMPLVVGPSNAAALRYLADVAHWPTRVAVLVGPHRSGAVRVWGGISRPVLGRVGHGRR